MYGGISHRYAQEQALDLSRAMGWQQATTYVDEWQSQSPGMSLAAVITSENVSECFTALANTKQVRACPQNLQLSFGGFEACIGPSGALWATRAPNATSA